MKAHFKIKNIFLKGNSICRIRFGNSENFASDYDIDHVRKTVIQKFHLMMTLNLTTTFILKVISTSHFQFEMSRKICVRMWPSTSRKDRDSYVPVRQGSTLVSIGMRKGFIGRLVLFFGYLMVILDLILTLILKVTLTSKNRNFCIRLWPCQKDHDSKVLEWQDNSNFSSYMEK